MKAIVLTGKAQAEYREIPTPECPEDGLLVKIEAVGLCGSDIRTYFHGHKSVTYPAVIGHENAGVIVGTGGKHTGGWAMGDRVVINPSIPCGKCYYCMHGSPDICNNWFVYGNDIPGGFAQYLAVPGVGVERGQILRVPDGISLDEITLTELMASVLKAQEQMRVTLGDTVVIFGCGPIGCLHTQIARLRGAGKIILADISQDRLELVKGFGADLLVNSGKEDIVSIVRGLTNGIGADVCIVAAPSAEPHRLGVELLKKEGRLSYFGGLNKEAPLSTVDGNLVHYNRIEIRGAYSYSFANFEQGFKLVSEGKIDKRIITHRLPLRDMEEGVRLVQAGKAIKVVLKPWEE